MKPKVQTKSIKRYTTSDGREWEDKREAEAHEAGLNVIRFFAGVVTADVGAQIVEAIREDPDGFREVIQPMLRRPRTKRAGGIDLDEVEPVRPEPEPPILAQGVGAEVAPKKRRGRPPGSRNKARVDGDGATAHA